MAFGSQMHDRVGLVLRQDSVQRRAVADIGLFKSVKRAIRDRGHVFKAGSIGQRIQIDDLMPARHGQPHHGRADEPCPTRYQQLHNPKLPFV